MPKATSHDSAVPPQRSAMLREKGLEDPRPLNGIISADVFTAAKKVREINSFTRDDGTPLIYSRVKEQR